VPYPGSPTFIKREDPQGRAKGEIKLSKRSSHAESESSMMPAAFLASFLSGIFFLTAF